MRKTAIRDIDVRGKRVLVREDFSVPLDPGTLAITDDSRIRVALPTIKYLLQEGAKVIICSHLGRPEGKIVERLRMAPVANRLSQALGKPVRIASGCIGPQVEAEAAALSSGEVLVLENVGFHAEEPKNDSNFAKALARLAEVYVNDAFGVAHRAYASTVGITRYIPSVAGFQLEKEYDTLNRALNSPAAPCAAIVGGTKVKDKIALLENMMSKVDSLLVAGGMGFTFLKAAAAGGTPSAEVEVETARRLIERSADMGVHLLLPTDIVMARGLEPDAKTKVVSPGEIPPNWQVMDIGPRTIKYFGAKLRRAKTIIWNGSLGIFELSRFRAGTTAIVELLAELDVTKIIVGGSIAEAIEVLGLTHKMTHVSTGGGAALRLFEGIPLPAVEALPDK
jgi:phosphoglycerate kinase